MVLLEATLAPKNVTPTILPSSSSYHYPKVSFFQKPKFYAICLRKFHVISYLVRSINPNNNL